MRTLTFALALLLTVPAAVFATGSPAPPQAVADMAAAAAAHGDLLVAAFLCDIEGCAPHPGFNYAQGIACRDYNCYSGDLVLIEWRQSLADPSSRELGYDSEPWTVVTSPLLTNRRLFFRR